MHGKRWWITASRLDTTPSFTSSYSLYETECPTNNPRIGWCITILVTLSNLIKLHLG